MGTITLLGSAAAEGIPAIFCDCEICRKAWQNKGKDFRMRTAYAFNERIRIDFGPDNLAQEYRFKLHSEKLRHLFVTHAHGDHLAANSLCMRRPGFSRGYANPLNIYGKPAVFERIREDTRGLLNLLNLNLLPVTEFLPIELPEEDMTFYPLPANHCQNPQEAVFYAVRHGNAWILIANDTGYYPEETWRWLAEQPILFDIVISDASFGTRDSREGHLGGRFVLAVKDRLTELKRINRKTRYIVTHFTHNCGALHKDLETCFHPHGIEVGYDGMILEY